jgi:thioester reductase-like protein
VAKIGHSPLEQVKLDAVQLQSHDNLLHVSQVAFTSGAGHVKLLSSNLSRKRLALSQELWNEISSRVEVMVHAGATVNLNLPLRQ